ncbi:MAG TPA: hypothetical protein GX406_03295 [Pseudoclavibacter sp.]|nr:hypothetical protein [Pseudoclavibacter sp.]
MLRGPRTRTRTSATLVAALCAALLISTPVRADDDDIPSWDDVTAAQQSEAETQELIDSLNSTLDAYEDAAAQAGDAAVTAQAAADDARARSDQAQTELTTLQAELAQAQEEYVEAVATAGAIVVSTMKTHSGIGITARISLSEDPDRVLDELTMSDRVLGIAGDALTKAQRAQQTVASLEEQTQQRAAELSELDAEAQQQADEATSLSAEADSALQEQLSVRDDLYEKLAALEDTTAEAIAQARQAEELQESYDEQAEAAQNAAQSQQESSGSSDTGGSQGSSSSTEDSSSSSGGSSSDSGSSNSGSTSGGDSTSGGSSEDTDPGGTSDDTEESSSSIDNSPAAAKAYAKSRMSAYGWDNAEYTCLVNLWTRESNWRYNATNSSSKAYGIPQALPGSKMASAGADWRTNSQTQITWGLSYISARYGTPCAAWDHSESTGWY